MRWPKSDSKYQQVRVGCVECSWRGYRKNDSSRWQGGIHYTPCPRCGGKVWVSYNVTPMLTTERLLREAENRSLRVFCEKYGIEVSPPAEGTRWRHFRIPTTDEGFCRALDLLLEAGFSVDYAVEDLGEEAARRFESNDDKEED